MKTKKLTIKKAAIAGVVVAACLTVGVTNPELISEAINWSWSLLGQ